MTLTIAASTAYAADDPLEAINNLTSFLYSLARAIGVIVTLFSIIQLGISIKSHDPTQRSMAIMGIVGGVIIMFAKEIIGLITG